MLRTLTKTILLAALGCVATVAAADRPVVHTRLAIEADTFRTGLGDDLATVESEVAEILAAEIDRYFKFVDWIAPAAVSSPPAADAELTLRLTASPKALGVAIELEYAPSIGDRTLESPERATELYGEFDEQPKDRADLLINDLREEIVERFNDDSFREKLQEKFLSRVPLTTQVEADETMKVILIPVSLEDLRATGRSRLAVAFKARNRHDALQDGSLRLDPAGGREDRPGWLQCTVEEFEFPPEDEKGWHASIPTVLGTPLLDHLVVYMLSYDLDPVREETSGRLVDTLDEGGGS